MKSKEPEGGTERNKETFTVVHRVHEGGGGEQKRRDTLGDPTGQAVLQERGEAKPGILRTSTGGGRGSVRIFAGC